MLSLRLNETDTLLIPEGVGESKRNPKKRTAMTLKPSLTTNVLALDFYKGYGHYDDLGLMLGRDTAHRIARLVVDYCQFDEQAYIRNVERISTLASTNPDDIEGVAETIVKLGMEFYLLARRHRLFDIGGKFKYEFIRFAGERVFLQERKIV